MPGLGGLRAEPDVGMHLGRFFSAWFSGKVVKEQAVFSSPPPLSFFLTAPDTVHLLSEGHIPIRDLMGSKLKKL